MNFEGLPPGSRVYTFRDDDFLGMLGGSPRFCRVPEISSALNIFAETEQRNSPLSEGAEPHEVFGVSNKAV
jgi:hypothetical protein